MTALADRNGHAQTFDDAVQAFHSALRLADPINNKNIPLWSMELANTLLLRAEHQPCPDRLATVGQAITLCQRSIDFTDREAHPWIWANAHHTFGVAAASMRQLETRTEDEQRAIDHFHLALEVFSETQYPYSWATTNLWLAKIASTRLWDAVGHTSVDERNSPSTMVEWIRLLKQTHTSVNHALQVFSPCTAPQSWAEAKALSIEYQLGSVKDLQDVIDALDLSRKLHSQTRSPLRWAEIHYDLAAALLSLYELIPKPDDLERAVEACSSALTVQGPAETPWHWARTQKTLGRAMLAMGKHHANAAHFEGAIAAYKSTIALTERHASPEDWADTVTSIGEATLHLGLHRDGVPRILEAVSLIQDALQAYDDAHHQMGPFNALVILCQAYVGLHPMVEDKQSIIDAVESVEQRARAVMGGSHIGWPTTRLTAAIGEALVEVSTEAGDHSGIQRGLEMLQQAVDESSDSRKLLEIAEMRIALALAYVGRISIGGGDHVDLERAGENIAAAVKFLHPNVHPFAWFGYVVVSSVIASFLSATDWHENPMDMLQSAESNVRRALDCLLADQSPIDRATALMLLGSILERQADISTEAKRKQDAERAFAEGAALLSDDVAPAMHKAAVLAFERIRGAA